MWTGHGYFPFRDLMSAMTERMIPNTDNAKAIIEIVFIGLSFFSFQFYLQTSNKAFENLYIEHLFRDYT